MKVCDLHTHTKAVDTITIQNDGTPIDVCAECKKAVLGLFSIPIEPGEPSVAPATDAKSKARLGLSFFKGK